MTADEQDAVATINRHASEADTVRRCGRAEPGATDLAGKTIARVFGGARSDSVVIAFTDGSMAVFAGSPWTSGSACHPGIERLRGVDHVSVNWLWNAGCITDTEREQLEREGWADEPE